MIATPYEIEVCDYDNHIEVRLWCLGIYKDNPNNEKTFLFRVRDFNTHVYAEVFDGKINILTPYTTKKNAQELIKGMCYNYEKYNLLLNDIKTENRIPIFYFQNNKKKTYIKIPFSTTRGKRSFVKDFQQENKNFFYSVLKRNVSSYMSFLHNDIPDEWVFMNEIGMKPCQTFEIEELTPLDLDSRISKSYIEEYIISKYEINPQVEKNIYIGNPKVFSYDIECLSKDGKTFPNPMIVKDCIFLITCYIRKYNNEDEERKVALHLGKVDFDVEGVEIIQYEREDKLLRGFFKLIEEEKPHIILGFNILAFDNLFIHRRMELFMENYPRCSHLRFVKPKMESCSWSSSAYANVEINYWKMSGIIIADMLTEIKRNFKFRNYKLDTVSKEILKESKVDISIFEMFKVRNLYEDGVWDEYVKDMTRKSIEYGMQDAILPLKLFIKCTFFSSYIQMANVNSIRIPELYTRGQRVRSKSNIYNTAMNKGYILTPKPKCSIGKFKGANVFDPKVGLHEIVICLDFASLYPSIMQTYNLCVSTFIKKEDWDKYEKDDCYIFETEDGEYRFIKETKFEGIIPYVIKGFMNSRKEAKNHMNSFEEQLEQEVDMEKYRELKKQIEQETDNDKLKDLKQQIEQITSMEIFKELSRKIILMNSLQLAVKVSNNSIYGGLGSSFKDEDSEFSSCKDFVRQTRKGELGFYNDSFDKDFNKTDISMKEISLCVTYIGRNLIKETMKSVCDEFNCIDIYGDTDSVMISLKDETDPKKCIEKGFIMEKFINDRLKKPLKIEFEKTMKMLSVTAKRYAYLLYNKNAEVNPLKELQIKGLLATRRDNSIWQQNVFIKIIEHIMTDKSEIEVRKMVIGEVYKLLTNQVPIEELTITASLREEYASDGNMLSIFKDYMKKKGTPIKAGERIEYVMVEIEGYNPKKDKKGILIRSLEDYIASQKTDKPYKIYHKYYIENKLQNSADQIFKLVYKNDPPVIKMIIESMKNYSDINDFITLCEQILNF